MSANVKKVPLDVQIAYLNKAIRELNHSKQQFLKIGTPPVVLENNLFMYNEIRESLLKLKAITENLN